MKKLYCDLETFCEVPLKQGTHRYAEFAEVMVFAFAVDDNPVQVWDMTDPLVDISFYPELQASLADPEVQIVFHNVGFDRTVLLRAHPELCPPLERWYCTMAKALAHGLPGSLATLGQIFNIAEDERKLKIGKQLVQLFCVPRHKQFKDRRATRETHPQEWARFLEYAALDVVAMRSIDKRIPEWNYRGDELALWHLDQTINQRGVFVDTDLASKALCAIERAQSLHGKNTAKLTEGEVESAAQRDKLMMWLLIEHGVVLPDMTASTLKRRVDDESLPQIVRDLISIRLESSMTSGAKYKRLIEGVNSDGRLRGLLQFCGAQRTGRWAGRLFQPQNLPRPTEKSDAIQFGIDALKAEAEDLLFPNVMRLAANSLRGVIIPPKGKKLVVSDLKNIEGRVVAWLAGEDWKLQAFRDYDEGMGADLYNLAYATSFNIQVEDVAPEQRQVGKVMELMLGFGGGVGAFVTGAATYRIDLNDLAAKTLPLLPPQIVKEVSGMWDWAVEGKRTLSLERNAYCACDAIKRLWRIRHPNIVKFWQALEDAVRRAIRIQGETLTVGRLKVRCDGDWLRIQLPSGRALCYVRASISNSDSITYLGINTYTRQWSKLHTYGGKLVENVTQAVARDVMAAAMAPAEKAGYAIVLTTHDELITEAPDHDVFNEAGLSAILATNPAWADGLPLAAAGFSGYRYYKKD